ncbi:hypothetical protein ACJZ2D_005484 [Fusarium nematophilum]
MNFFASPPVLEPDALTTLPSTLRTIGTSEHSTNQKRGRPLDSFLEGPVVTRSTLYLADIPYGRIFAVDLSTKEWTIVIQYDGEPNGLAWHEQRQRLLIADFKQGILSLDIKTKTLSTVMDRFNGERLKGPNDLVVARDGSIIFTDQGMSGLQDPTGRVYRLSSNFNQGSRDNRAEILLRNCPSPNGVVLDATEKNLFVAMTRDNSVWLAPLYPDSSVQRTGRFSSYFGVGGPDGLLTDEEGNIFVAHSTLGTVFVHNKDGTPRAAITTKEFGSGSTNLTWGGGDLKTLFIVESLKYASESKYSLGSWTYKQAIIRPVLLYPPSLYSPSMMNQATKPPTPGTLDASNGHGSPSSDPNMQPPEEAAKHPASRRPLLAAETSSSSLEDLPPELRSKILASMPDLPTLRAVVRASPVLHMQYLHDRNSILRACLDRELDGFLVDAYATFMSRVRELGWPRTNEMITSFLGKYSGWLSGSAPYPGVDSIPPSSVRWMAATHVSVARPLARRYTKWALSNLREASSPPASQDGAAESTSVPEDHDISLTRNEEIRIYRALYRYHTFYHLFGRNKGTRRGGFRHHEVNETFFCILDPWDAEAVGCIELFVRDQYEDIFYKVKADLHPKNPRFRLPNGIYNPEGSFDLDAEHDDYMDGTMSRGPKMTARLLAINDHETLVTTMEKCLTHDQNLDWTMGMALSTLAQDDRRGMSVNPPTARDEAQTRKDAMNFAGDAEAPDGPPFAWVLLWGGKYANIYGEYVPRSLRRWGYVLWDEQRWIEMGAKELVRAEWQDYPDLVREIEMDYDWRPV